MSGLPEPAFGANAALRALAAEIDDRRAAGCEAHASERAIMERARLADCELPGAMRALERMGYAQRCWMPRSQLVWKLTDPGREAAGRLA